MTNMDFNEATRILMETQSMRDKLGEVFYDCVMEDDNSTREMGKSLMNVVFECETQEQFDIVDKTVIAICGWSIKTLLEKVEKRDNEGYHWESL